MWSAWIVRRPDPCRMDQIDTTEVVLIYGRRLKTQFGTLKIGTWWGWGGVGGGHLPSEKGLMQPVSSVHALYEQDPPWPSGNIVRFMEDVRHGLCFIMSSCSAKLIAWAPCDSN